MRWLIVSFACCLIPLPFVGCSSEDRKVASKMEARGGLFGMEEGAAPALPQNFAQAKADQGGAKQPKADEPAAKKEKPRKIRYTGDMQLIVKDINDAEEALDAVRKEAKGEYERAEVNRSVNIVRSGIWRIRVPVENLHTFRKAVAKIGDVEKDTIESEDMTAKYYDLEAHLANRKAERDAVREFLTEIGKKDQRYMEVKRELNEISDDINRKEGQIKLWKDMTDLTTFTVHMREKQLYDKPAPPKIEPDPTFGQRIDRSWTRSWEAFIGFCQGVAIVAVALAPWLPIGLVACLILWFLLRRGAAPEPEAPVVEVVADSSEEKK